ncbi:hypothetical protein D9M70_574690 [compost metagenome]
MTRPFGSGRARLGAGRLIVVRRWRTYQVLTQESTKKPMIATIENQLRLPWPKGMTMKAASSGPMALPALPPTWKSDCANPWRPPEARRAMRDDSGWKIAEPMPIRLAATSRTQKSCAFASRIRPLQVESMASGSE